MDVLVDGWELHPGSRRRGIGRFLDGLLPPLAARAGVTVTVLQRPTDGGTLDVPPGTRGVPVRRWIPRERIRAGTLEHVARLPTDLRRTPHDVLLSPGTLPPRRTPRPWVQTLHDLAPLVLDHPDYGFARRQWRLLGGRLRHADRVVAVSRFTADEAVRVLDLDPGSIEVVPHGVDAAFRPDGPVAGGAPYLVSVCTRDPRKGLAEAVALAKRLRDLDTGHELRIAGDLTDRTRAWLDAAPGVSTEGHVDELPALLRGATAAVVTSRYEGFGFAALEAMACGTPVVAFDNTAVGEVVGDGGLLVRDGNVEAMARTLADLLADAGALAQWREAALTRAARFSWEAAAEAYATILAEVA